jgi:hypothetical protein
MMSRWSGVMAVVVTWSEMQLLHLHIVMFEKRSELRYNGMTSQLVL